MTKWRALLLPYRELNVRLREGGTRARRFHHVMTDDELRDALESFAALPALAADLSGGRVSLDSEVRYPDVALTTLSAEPSGFYWPSPNDVRRELEEFAPAGSFQSIFVLWPQHDTAQGSSIRCRGWGLGMGPGESTNGATYAVVSNAPSSAWRGEAPGEVWLHEWLHGVCTAFASVGYEMPDRDADGAEIHGYVRSPTMGWTQYYRDLMTGNVSENGRSLGIPLAAWRAESHPV